MEENPRSLRERVGSSTWVVGLFIGVQRARFSSALDLEDWLAFRPFAYLDFGYCMVRRGM